MSGEKILLFAAILPLIAFALLWFLQALWKWVVLGGLALAAVSWIARKKDRGSSRPCIFHRIWVFCPVCGIGAAGRAGSQGCVGYNSILITVVNTGAEEFALCRMDKNGSTGI